MSDEVTSAPAAETPSADTGVETPADDFQTWREASEAGAKKDQETPTAADPSNTAKTARETEPAKPTDQARRDAHLSPGDKNGSQRVGSEESEEDDDSDEPGDPAKPRKKGGFRRTIDRLTRQNQELTAKMSALEQRLGAPQNGEAPVREQPAGRYAPSETASDRGYPQDAKSDEEKMPVEADYPDDYVAFLQARTDWQTRKTMREVEQTRAREAAERAVKEAERKIRATWQERQAAVSKSLPDYDDVVSNSTAPMSLTLQDFLLEAEEGPEVLYHLAKNPSEAERIFSLSAIAQVREGERIAAQIRPKSAPQPKTASVSSAPKPVRPLAGGSAPDAEGAAPQTEFYDVWFPKQEARLARAKRA